MNGRQAKRARSAAYKEAERSGLWKKGEASLYEKWWRKLAARLFPKIRARYMNMVGRWYKATIKAWARVAFARTHDPEWQSYMHARAKMDKARRRGHAGS